jgi:hypothetical protein
VSLYAFTSYSTANPVTPADATPQHFRALIVTVAGNLVVTPLYGSGDITFTAVPCGVLIPIETKFVKSTGTTASVAGLF